MNPWVIKNPNHGDSQPFIDMDRVQAIRASVEEAQLSISTVSKQANVVGDKEMEGVLSRASFRLSNRLEVVDRLVSEGPTLVLVAGKGTGKTFLSNILCNSWLHYPEATFGSIEQNAIQPVGEGGTTPCEFRYVYSESWGVDIEPAAYAEVWQLVEPMLATIARRQLKIPSAMPVDADEAGDGESGTFARTATSNSDTKDIVSAARISEIPPIEIDKERTLKGICFGGRVPSEREIREILTTKSLSAWRDEVVTASNLNHRQGQTMRLRPSEEISDHRVWLRDCLIAILKGKVHAQPYPKCVVVAGPIFPSLFGGAKVTIIDTLGLPPGSTTSAIFGREDIAQHIRDDRALLLFATSGENPPEPTAGDIYATLESKFDVDDERFAQRHRRLVVGTVFKFAHHNRSLDDENDAGLEARCEVRLDICRSELRTKTRKELLCGGVHVAENSVNERFRTNVEAGFINIVEDCLLRAELAVRDARDDVQRAKENRTLLNKKIMKLYRDELRRHSGAFANWQVTIREAPIAGLIEAVKPARQDGWLHHMSVYSMARGNGEGASWSARAVITNTVLEQYHLWRSKRYNVSLALDNFKKSLDEKFQKIVAQPASVVDGVLTSDDIVYIVGTNDAKGQATALKELLLADVEELVRTLVYDIADSFVNLMLDDDAPLWTHSQASKRKKTMMGIWEDKSQRPVKIKWAERLTSWQAEARVQLIEDADEAFSNRLNDNPNQVESAWPYPETVALPEPDSL